MKKLNEKRMLLLYDVFDDVRSEILICKPSRKRNAMPRRYHWVSTYIDEMKSRGWMEVDKNNYLVITIDGYTHYAQIKQQEK